MESYFVRIRPVNGDVGSIRFIGGLVAHGIEVQEYRTDHLVHRSFMMRIVEKDRSIQEVSFEGCFSWYDEGLKQCFELLQTINNCMVAIWIFLPDNTPVPMSEDIFVQQVKDFYREKYKIFISRYGEMNVKLPPDKMFYKFIETRKIPFLRKLFRK